MRKAMIGTAAALAVALLAGVLVAEDGPAKDAPARDAPKGVAGLTWLAGDWSSDDDDGGAVFDEHWLAPRGDAMFAVSRFVAGGTTKLCELSAIEDTADGTWLRLRHLSRSLALMKRDAFAPLSFKLLEQSERSVVFEDAASEFPRRIVYRREGDVLTARLEGTRDGKPADEEFILKLTKAR